MEELTVKIKEYEYYENVEKRVERAIETIQTRFSEEDYFVAIRGGLNSNTAVTFGGIGSINGGLKAKSKIEDALIEIKEVVTETKESLAREIEEGVSQ